MENSIEVILVDDHKIFRIGLEAIIDSFEGISVIAGVDNGDALFQLLRKTEPDIIFMDIHLGNENGIDLTKKVIARYPDIIVIALTSSDEVNNFTEMLEAGASAFLLKNAAEPELQKAIEMVAKGESYFSKEFLYLAKNFYKKPKRRLSVALSDREKEVLALICLGHSNQEIAETIELSIHTVDTHRRNLLSKTGARNTASLVMIALRDELVDLDV